MFGQPRRRGGCLTVFLMLMLIGNFLMGLYFLTEASKAKRSLPSIPGWTVPVLGLLCIANFVFAVAIWKWKKWGMYGFVASALVTFELNLSIGLPFIAALPGLGSIVILILLVHPVWSYFE